MSTAILRDTHDMIVHHDIPLPPANALLSRRDPASDPEKPVRYCLYARKSSEADEKQALSIDSQICEMMRIAEVENLHVVETLRESKSAKAS